MKTVEEIKANAPDGATHYYNESDFGGVFYFKVTGDDVFIWQIYKRFTKLTRRFDEYNNIKPL